MKELVTRLKEEGLTIASIESLTGGMFAALVSGVAGASSVLKGGLVTYQTVIKEDVLRVDKKLIAEYGVISKQCAQAMAVQGKKMFTSDIVVSCSGNAGPDAMDGKPVGLVYMGVLVKDEVTTYEMIFKGSRNEIREQVCEYLKEKVLERLNK